MLNGRIEEFLGLLSLYAAESSSHRILEYMIRRYRIHELNVNALLRCMISQHDTPVSLVLKIYIIASDVF